MNELLQREIALLPDKPGVYEMKDANDKIIYIGKAKNLKKRVSQYFLRPQSGKVFAMVSHVDHFDTIIVGTNKEAFILEMNLIQTYYPRYNIMLTDDSHYPYIALRRGNDPYLRIARHPNDRRYYYFGPFPDSSDAYKTIDILNKVYPTRKCRNMPNKPCLYYHLGQCLAPCFRQIDPGVYEKLYGEIKKFLNGDSEEIKKTLYDRMQAASDNQEYEKALEYKKTIEAIDHTTAKQNVEISDRIDRDVFAYAQRDGYVCLSILAYRKGLLLGKENHIVAEFDKVEEEMTGLIESYYQTHELPQEIVCNIGGFSEDFGQIYPEANVVSPKEGRLLESLNLAELNARQGLDAHFMSARLSDDSLALLDELGKLLGIETPYRIELFDNSHLQGSSPVGAMVCYINGEPAKKMYRKFHLDEKDAGDDYHSMKEIVYRRYSRLKDEGLAYPDLILTDGGITQVHACLEALKNSEVKIPVYGLYKNDRHQTEGIVDKDGNVFPLGTKSPLFFLLMRMQDEVHRFAISFHRLVRAKSMKLDVFDEIAGLGPKRKEVLRKHYPTVDSLKAASEAELSQLLPDKVAKALYERIRIL